MFYFLSKILDVLVTPIAWSSALVVAGVLRSPRGKGLALLGVVVLVGFSLEPVSNALFRSLETTAGRSPAGPGAGFDVVILLGGLTDERVEGTWGGRAFNDNNERLLETFDLLRSGAARNAILTGGGAPSTPKSLLEARTLADQLVAWGIDPERLVVEDQARNTHENATLSARIVREKGWTRVALVTSAFHMPRAAGCFHAEGIDVTAFPVDYRSFGGGYPADLLPRADHLAESSAALREWVGRVVYRARGYSR